MEQFNNENQENWYLTYIDIYTFCDFPMQTFFSAD